MVERREAMQQVARDLGVHRITIGRQIKTFRTRVEQLERATQRDHSIEPAPECWIKLVVRGLCNRRGWHLAEISDSILQTEQVFLERRISVIRIMK